MTKDEALKEIDRLARENGIAYILFESIEDAGKFMRDMRAAHAMKTKMDALGVSMPEGFLM